MSPILPVMVQPWSSPWSPSMEGAICMGPWGVNQSPVGSCHLPESTAYSPIPNHTAMWARSSIYSLMQHTSIEFRCQAGSVIGTGNNLGNKACFLFSVYSVTGRGMDSKQANKASGIDK